MPDAPGGMAGNGVVFVVPDGRPPSGGDLYNRFLVRALEAEGFPVETCSIARLRTSGRPVRTEYWVDSLYIPMLAESDPFDPRDRVFFIIHSLPSADPGIPGALAGILRRAEDRLFARASGFLVTGEGTGRTLAARGFAGRPVLLVPPAIRVRPEGGPAPPRGFSGLIVSSLIRGKGVPDFLEALGGRVRAEDVFVIRIAGRTDIEPGTAASCLAAIGAHPLLRRRVSHLGLLPYEEMGPEYEKSSALISPSASESFGMAFHEARAFGLPILAIRAAYSEPFVEDGRTGLLFDSAADLAQGVLELAREPDRQRRLAEAADRARPKAAYAWADAARSFLSQRSRCGIFRDSR